MRHLALLLILFSISFDSYSQHLDQYHRRLRVDTITNQKTNIVSFVGQLHSEDTITINTGATVATQRFHMVGNARFEGKGAFGEKVEAAQGIYTAPQLLIKGMEGNAVDADLLTVASGNGVKRMGVYQVNGGATKIDFLLSDIPFATFRSGINATNTIQERLQIGASITSIASLSVKSEGTSSGSTALLVENLSGVDLLNVLDNGNVGIGVTTPLASLDVKGSVKVLGTTTLDGDISVINGGLQSWTENANNHYFHISKNNSTGTIAKSSFILANSVGNLQLTQYGSGFVGDEQNTSVVRANDASNGLYLLSGSHLSGFVKIGVSQLVNNVSDEGVAIIVDKDKQVGIGTLVPINTLHVVGVTRHEGDIRQAMGGTVIGASVRDVSAALEIVSTTQGVLFPRMTTTQRDLITTPTDGLVIYNSILNKLQVRAASAWKTLQFEP